MVSAEDSLKTSVGFSDMAEGATDATATRATAATCKVTTRISSSASARKLWEEKGVVAFLSWRIIHELGQGHGGLLLSSASGVWPTTSRQRELDRS